jgi:biopolymer transport protein ExbD
MAKRNIGEINAGSMADIAFLLLIFFLVTTTMEVDAGIARNLPLKQDRIIDIPPVTEPDVLEISVNSKDELFVEDQRIQISELEEVSRSFYTINANGIVVDPTMPEHDLISATECQQKINHFQHELSLHPHNKIMARELQKWEQKKSICLLYPSQSFYEISTMAIVKIDNQANTSFGIYIQIQNILKKVVNDLRQEKCTELGWGNYHELNEHTKQGKERLKQLRILVPERIIESKIEQ